MTTASELVSKKNLNDPLILPYGSRVYGTHSDKSDFDYIVVADNAVTGEELAYGDINLQFYSDTDFQSQLNQHKINVCEVYFYSLPKKFKFTLNLGNLRQEISAKASNSFVKAKKKIEKEKEYYVGWKSLFHSLRIFHFGIQIATHGKIIDFSEANHLWKEILEANCYDWAYFKQHYQPIYNNLATNFRKLAPQD